MRRKVINHVSVKGASWKPRYVMDIMTVEIGLMKVNVSLYYSILIIVLLISGTSLISCRIFSEQSVVIQLIKNFLVVEPKVSPLSVIFSPSTYTSKQLMYTRKLAESHKSPAALYILTLEVKQSLRVPGNMFL
jgi:hypothetical protein